MRYEVVLWQRFQRGVIELPFSGDVEACSSLSAVYALMRRYKLSGVRHACVVVAPGSVERWCVGHGFWMRL
jgi:hypothetical protein